MPVGLRVSSTAGAVLALALAACDGGQPASGPAPGARSARPSVVLLIVDTLRADQLGAYGHPAPVSPELDAYAHAGVRFERVIAQCTWTRPSIGSLLTSLYPRTLGLYREREQILSDRFATLAELLRERGYWTAGATANPNLNAWFRFDQGFDSYRDSEVLLSHMPGYRKSSDGRPLDFAGARTLLADLEGAIAAGRPPYYLQATLMDVHEYEVIDASGEPFAALEDADPRPDRVQYLKAVRRVSLEIDRFIRSLSRRPGFEHTLFVVTSDHGETLSADHPALADPKWHGYLVYETQALVPLILYSTAGDLPAGRVIRRPVRLVDVLPTVLDYAGIETPEGIAGVSLLPLLRDAPEEVALPEKFVVETHLRSAHKLAVYSGEWIYIENRDRHRGTNAHELQRVGGPADGVVTDQAAAQRDVVGEHARYLAEWSRSHPPARPTRRRDELPSGTDEQLRALGYVD